jgi:ABC-type glycerol-3-phosphate transport system substrate-binding protein
MNGKHRTGTVLRLAIALGLVFLAGNAVAGGKTDAGESKANAKTDIVLMIETASSPLNKEKIIPKLREKFPDINFISKPKDDSQIEKAVKTTFIGGDAIDIVGYWPNQMRIFTESNMALDLTPYLDADPQWKGVWSPGAVESGKIDGKYVAVSYRTTYPLIQINKSLFEKAGVPVKDKWTWAEFVDACRKIQANTDAFPFGINSVWGCWLVRNGLLQIWDTEAEMEAFNRGDVSFTDSRVKKVFADVDALYKSNYIYPGEGALTASNDQVLSAFARGRVAMIGNVNGNAMKTVKDTVAGAFEVVTVSWPNMGSPSSFRLLGGNDGYFVPANTKNPAKTVEVLKYLTSVEILQLWADDGKIVPSGKVTSSDANYAAYGKDASSVVATEIIQISSEINDYIVNNIPANYVLYGERALAELEDIRKTIKK